LLCALLPFVLALWQWQRGVGKQDMEAALSRASGLPVQSLLSRSVEQAPDYAQVSIPMAQAVGLPLRLDNSLLDEQAGVRLLQLARLPGGRWILLDLGWLAAGRTVPPVVLPTMLHGQWLPWHARFVLPGARRGSAGLLDDLDRMALLQRYPGAWYAGVVQLQPCLPGLRPWPLLPEVSSRRHFAYALQWSLLACCLLWLAWRAGRRLP